MLHQDAPGDAAVWRRRAVALARRLNFHHWLSRFVPKLFVVLVLVALGELWRREVAGPVRWSEAALLLGIAVAAGWAWLEARRHFCTAAQALVRLETVLGLHNRLSAAQAGVVPWPPVPAAYDDGYVANGKQVLAPLLAGVLFLAAAHFVPVSPARAAAAAGTIAEPPDFAQVQNWINALKAADVIEPEKLQDLQSALDNLRQRPAQDWYTQSNLEAADSLKELTEQSLSTLSQDLSQADDAVESMRDQMQSGADASSLRAMQDKLSQAGDNLSTGTLPLKRELVSQMKNGDASGDKPLSASQLAQLHERLKKGATAAQTAPRANGGFGDEMQRALADAERAGGAGGHGRKRIGTGGLGGGKETAPLELQDRDRTTPDGAMTPVTNEDMSHATLGETTKITAGKPQVNPAAYGGPQGAGAAQVQGNGGEAVWRSTYDPQEADTLSRFFK